jgi:cell division septation protein DedD
MEQKQRFFIYDRKEVWILVLLGVMVAAFAFTLGVHLGKRVGTVAYAPAPGETTPAATLNDQVPNRQEITEQSKAAQQAADETLSQAAHDEAARTGVQLEAPRAVELPREAKKPAAGATTETASAPESPQAAKLAREALQQIPAAQRPLPLGKFTLQIGSFPALAEAKDQVESMEALGLKPFLRPAEVKGKGRRYRIFLGGYTSRDAAEKAGKRYLAQHVIDSYVIANLSDS